MRCTILSTTDSRTEFLNLASTEHELQKSNQSLEARRTEMTLLTTKNETLQEKCEILEKKTETRFNWTRRSLKIRRIKVM